jgi:hypothetical protein
MKQFATIVFVLIFALAGKSQSQDLLCKQISCNSLSIANKISIAQKPVIFQDFYLDGQETNDLDGFNSFSVLPGLYHFFQHFEISSFKAASQPQQIIQIGELLLDLPPPSFSV